MAFAIERLSRITVRLFPKRLPSTKTIHTSAQLDSFKTWYQSKWTPRKTEAPYAHVIQVGDPILRQKSSPVPLDAIKSKELNFFIDQLIDVLHNYKLVGIAAPQVGIGLRIIVMEFDDRLVKDEFTAQEYKVREMENLPLTVSVDIPKIWRKKIVNETKSNLIPDSNQPGNKGDRL